MQQREEYRHRSHGGTDQSDPVPARTQLATDAQVASDVDEVLEEIDGVLKEIENVEDWVRGFVQRGGE
ncbi:ubiquitin-like protein Pup [Streptomyces sp. NPDC026665]|uniref:ubiquitin-like protein Pup n=1 Tax=Streptomyces sp. NPDC026665 TaxID=3154798 RepID=UPI0033D637D9